MYRILIVDDEPIIADGLYEELLLCDGLDADVYRVYSGKSALELLERHRIDIVVTDIRMPGMDGMALLERIKDSWPECRVIFLTGHREFDYIYKAIQYKGLQYVLKTEGYARVISAVRSAAADIDGELQLHDQMDAMRRKADAASMFMQKELLKRMLEGCTPGVQDLAEYGIDLRLADRLLLVACRLECAQQQPAPFAFVSLCQAVRLVAEQYLGAQMKLACIPDDQPDIIIFAQPKKLAGGGTDGERAAVWKSAVLFVQETLELMQASVKAVLGCTSSFCISAEPVEWRAIPLAVESIKRTMNLHIGQGAEMLLTWDIADDKKNWPAGDRETAKEIKPKIDALSALLERGEREEYMKAFEILAACLDRATDRQNSQAGELYYSLALMLHSHLNRWQLQEKLAPAVNPGLLLNAGGFATWAQAAGYLRQVTSAVFGQQQAYRDRKASDILRRLKTYIDSHLGEELSLFRLSEIMYFNPSYLSRLFKQLSGENLTEYIQEKRVGMAKGLLTKNDIKINDIALAVGFGSATNFTRFFKKSTGMTPAEYRDRLSAGKAGIEM